MQMRILFMFLSILVATGCTEQASDYTANTEVKNEMVWKFKYDDLGLMTSLTGPGDAVTKISYEIDESKHFIKQVTKKHEDSSEVIYKYDRFNRRVMMIDTTGKVGYEYNKDGHLAVIRRDGYPTVSYTYDTMDRISSMSIGDKFTVKYIYDFLGRLSKIETGEGPISFNYQTSQGVMIRSLPNGIRTVWKNRPDGNLEEISHVEKDDKIITQFKYDYRADGMISGMSHWDQRWGNKMMQFEYDDVQRLSTVTDSSGKEIEYQYDKLGNRTALFMNGQKKNLNKFNWAGQMVTHNDQACTYDAAGNLMSFSGSKGLCDFEYNAMGSVKTVKLNDVSVKYQYDGDGYLIARNIGKKKTLYVPNPMTDNWNPLLAIDNDGKKTFYIWDAQSPLMAIKGNDVKFFLNDHLGSARCVVDKKGKILSKYDFSPFGVSEDNFTGTDLTPGYAGLFFDGSVSMYLTRARVYDPQAGRFLQTDPQHRIPFGSQKDLSPYVYCGGDPVNYVDRNGAEPKFFMGQLAPYWESAKAIGDIAGSRMKKDWDDYSTSAEAVFSTSAGEWFELAKRKDFRRPFLEGYMRDLRQLISQVKYLKEGFKFDLLNPPVLKEVERPDVLREIEAEVWKGTNSIEVAHRRANEMRNKHNHLRKSYEGNDPAVLAEFATKAAELATIENAIYAGVRAKNEGKIKAILGVCQASCRLN